MQRKKENEKKSLLVQKSLCITIVQGLHTQKRFESRRMIVLFLQLEPLNPSGHTC